ncbi:uncharacterized protein LOC117108762 isoform X2 [Anneissia japonica]|uniref:uncharacterized protein LOC117108762 isoform X2 n=1 Tax=Anneissia japonica TaxID=1529436 RepID=UPI00142591ED|nr:uncharacterized protein LOC117108762 isoform X2 [Anneissia japonica]
MKKNLISFAKQMMSTTSQSHLQRPGSTASLSFPKGLLNAPGENNCFLNSAVQVLWHLDIFRRSFRNYVGHACMGNSCIFCALKVIFTQFQYGEEQALPPDALRHALAENFKNQQRFQLGCMDDAAECFENILCRIHFHVAHDIREDLCNVKHCVPHRKFGMTLLEISKCRCGATSEPFPFTQMVSYVSCKALCSEFRKSKIQRVPRTLSFGELLHRANAVGDIRACPSNCGKKIQIQRIVTNSPEVVSIGLVWDTDRPSVDHIMDVIKCLGTTLLLKDIFSKVLDDKTRMTNFILVGVVTYYGKHYSTFFYNTRFRMWIYFDDATVKTVGPNWRDVVERCRKGHYQPLLLIFADPNGQAVSMDTAPKNTFLVNGPPDSDGISDTDTSEQHEPEVFSAGVSPLSINHNHYNSTCSSTSTQSYKSFTSFDSTNTVIYKPPADHTCKTPSINDSRPPKPARSSSSDMFREIQPIPEFKPQVESVDAVGGYNRRTSRTTASNQNFGVVEIGKDVRKIISTGGTTNFCDSYINEERKRLDEYAKQKKVRDQHRDIADEMVPILRTENHQPSNMHLPKFPASRDLIDFTQEEKMSKKLGDSPRTSGEYDDQLMWSDNTNSQSVSTAPQRTLSTSTLGLKPKRQPSFQYAIGTSTVNSYSTSAPKPELAGSARNTNVSEIGRPQRAMNKSEPVSSQASYRTDYNCGVQRSINGSRSQTVRKAHTQDKFSSYRMQTPTNLESFTVDSNQSSNWTENPTDIRRSLVSSLSVPDLSEKLAQMSKEDPINDNGYSGSLKGSQWDPQLKSQFGSQPDLHVDKPELNTSYSSSMTYERPVQGVQLNTRLPSNKMAIYKPAPTIPHNTNRTTSASGYNIQNGFLTLPRKRQSSCSQNAPMKGDHVSDMVVKGNHPIAQRSDYYDRAQRFIQEPQPVSATLTPVVLDQFQQTNLYYTGITQPTISKADALEVGSLGRDSGYRSGDRNSTSSGSIYSIDMLADYLPSNGSSNSRTETHQQHSRTTYENVDKRESRDTHTPTHQSLGDLFDEADKLIRKSRIAEDSDDLASALSMITNSILNIKQALKYSEIDSQTRVLLEDMYQSTVSRSRSLHSRLQMLQRQDSSQSSNADEDLSSLPYDGQLSGQFQKMNLASVVPHSTTFQNSTQTQGSERFPTTEPLNRYRQSNTGTYAAPMYPKIPKQYISTSTKLQGIYSQPAQSNYPQYSRDLRSEVTKLNDISQVEVKYTQPHNLYRAESHIKGRDMPQYASAATAPLERPPSSRLQRTHSEELLDGYTGRRQSVKDKISIFENQQVNGIQTERGGHYTGQDLYRPPSRPACDYSQEQPTYKSSNRPIRRTQTLPSNAQMEESCSNYDYYVTECSPDVYTWWNTGRR